eukprot:COSAG02_NODE_16127_length_1111_cov_1.005929_1_plen_63_part_01
MRRHGALVQALCLLSGGVGRTVTVTAQPVMWNPGFEADSVGRHTPMTPTGTSLPSSASFSHNP